MATPRVDVTQAVGRILRKKHDNAEVYDIESASNISETLEKRMTFYRKQKFRIFNITVRHLLKINQGIVFLINQNIKSNIKVKKRTKNKAPKDKLTIKIETDLYFKKMFNIMFWYFLRYNDYIHHHNYYDEYKSY